MIKHFELNKGLIEQSTIDKAVIEVVINPDPEETNYLINTFNIDEHTLQSALDPDEISRVEMDPEQLAIIFKRPKSYSANDMFLFRISSIGLFLMREKMIIVLPEDVSFQDNKYFSRVPSLKDFTLKWLNLSITHFLGHLKVINKISDELEQKINASMENKHLINMFTLEKSLVYYLNAIHSNSVTMEKLKSYAARINFSTEQLEFLDDMIIENQQCYKQAEIYSNVLTGLMDARGSVVNNNLNILIKRLTIINVLFMPLNLIAGIGGMSEFSMMTRGMDWRISYSLFLLGMIVIGFITYHIVQKIGLGSANGKK